MATSLNPSVVRLALASLLLAAPLGAQQVPVPALRAGQAIRAGLAGDTTWRGAQRLSTGYVRTSTRDTLRLRVETTLGERAMPWRDVVRLDTLVGRPSRRGHALVGGMALGAVGAWVGLMALGLSETRCKPHCLDDVLGAGGAGFVAFGLVGAGIGAAIPPSRRWAPVIAGPRVSR